MTSTAGRPKYNKFANNFATIFLMDTSKANNNQKKSPESVGISGKSKNKTINISTISSKIIGYHDIFKLFIYLKIRKNHIGLTLLVFKLLSNLLVKISMDK